MTFVNPTIDPGVLPKAHSLHFTPMAASYPKEVVTQHVLTWLILVVAASVPWLAVAKPAALRFWLGCLPLAFIALGFAATWFAHKAAKARGYALREHDIAHRSGLIFRKKTYLAFNRIQHIELSQGPLQRRFGLASLKFFSAGGQGVDMKIDGLIQADAKSLRQLILLRIGAESLGDDMTPTADD